MPREDVLVEEFDVGPVPVTIVSTEGRSKTAKAVRLTRDVLTDLQADFGPFPMPSMQILLIDWPDGMEYYGATTTGLSSLSHELVHMYWGCSAVNRTWRDTWFDEAVTVWWDESVSGLPRRFSSDLVGGLSPIELGFDSRAYGRGAKVIAELAKALGGDAAMIDFLADLHRRRVFKPFTTDEFVDDLVCATGNEGLRANAERWLHARDELTSPEIRGVWRRLGYGQLLEVGSREWTTYEVTAVSCERVDHERRSTIRRRVNGVTISADRNRLSFNRSGDVNRFEFERVEDDVLDACRDRTDRHSTDPVLNFEIFWHTFAENAPFFAERGIDWQTQYDKYRPLIDADTSRAELEGYFVAMAKPLNDGHAELRGEPLYEPTPVEQRLSDEWAASGTKKGLDRYVRSQRRAFDRLLTARYLGGDLSSAVRYRIHWGLLNPDVGYLRIDAMDGYSRHGGVDRMVEKARRVMRRVVREFRGLDAVVIDLRWNGGGVDETGLAIAGFFTDEPYLAFTKSALDGGDGRMGPTQRIHILPQSATPFVGRVYLLTSGLTASAAEVFALAMRSRGDVVLVGEPSQGALSDALDRELPNGWSFSLSNEVYLDPDGVSFEGRGLPVEIEAPFFAPADRTAGVDRGLDAILDATSDR